MSEYVENENFTGLKNTISDVIPQLNTYYNSISDLETRIDNVSFDSNTQIYQFFGTLRYLSGDIIYTTTFGIITLIILFYLFRMFKHFVNFILGFTPLNIRLP